KKIIQLPYRAKRAGFIFLPPFFYHRKGLGSPSPVAIPRFPFSTLATVGNDRAKSQYLADRWTSSARALKHSQNCACVREITACRQFCFPQYQRPPGRVSRNVLRYAI